MITVFPLDRRLMERNIDAIVAVAQDVPGEYWGAEHFLIDRPGKFTLSRLGLRGDAVVGYAVLSARDSATCHLHHMMVRAQDRGTGAGRCLLVDALAGAIAAGHRRMTLKVAPDNAAAIRFYERLGFAQADLENGLSVMARALP